MAPKEQAAATSDNNHSVYERLSRAETRIDYLEDLSRSINKHLCSIDEKMGSMPALMQSVNTLSDRVNVAEQKIEKHSVSLGRFSAKSSILQGLLMAIFVSVFMLVVKALTGSIL